MVRAHFILLLLAAPCYFQPVPPSSATLLALNDSQTATVGDSGSLDKTIDEMVKKTGLTLSEDQLGLVKSMASGNFHAKTLTKMMGTMVEDLKKDQKDEFNDFANRVIGWKRKKETIQNKMILELANGSTDAKNMRDYMKHMNLNAIINTVQKTYSGSPEWDRIKAFVDRVNKDPHGSSNVTFATPTSNKTATTVTHRMLTAVSSNTSIVTTLSPSTISTGSNYTTATPSVPSFTFVFVPPGNATNVNMSTNSGPSWNSIMSLFTSPPTTTTSSPNTTGTTNSSSAINSATITSRLPIAISSITPTNSSNVPTLPPFPTHSNNSIMTSNSILPPTVNVTLLPPLTAITLQNNATTPSTNRTGGLPVPPPPHSSSVRPLPLQPPLPTNGTNPGPPLPLSTDGHSPVLPNNGSNLTTVSVPLTTSDHAPNTTVLPSTNTTGPTPLSVPPQNPNASPQSSSEEAEPETGKPDPVPEGTSHDPESHGEENQDLDVNAEEAGEDVSAEETVEGEGSGENDDPEEGEGSGEEEPSADEPIAAVEEGFVEEGSGEAEGSGEEPAVEAAVMPSNEEPGH